MTEEMTTVTAPDWKQKADKLNEILKTNPEAAGEQVVYRSRQGLNDDPVCVPELVSEEMKDNSYPDVVTAPPTDMVSPKYSWYGDTGWFENATQQQGTRITALENNIKTVSQSVDDLKKDKQTEVTTSQEQDEKMDQLIKLVTMTNAQVGGLLKQPAGSTTISQPSQSTSAVTTQPTALVAQPVQSSTTTEGGKK